jgi:hypothetical protein
MGRVALWLGCRRSAPRDTGLRFWAYVTTGPLTLLTLVNLFAAWRASGPTRRMTVRAKAPRRVVHVDLEPGSLFVMDYATQLHYTHAVPKTGEPTGERISLAFRVKRPADASAGGFYR